MVGHKNGEINTRLVSTRVRPVTLLTLGGSTGEREKILTTTALHFSFIAVHQEPLTSETVNMKESARAEKPKW